MLPALTPDLSPFIYHCRTLPCDQVRFNHSFIRYTLSECQFGQLLLAYTEQGICAVFLGDSQSALFSALLKTFPFHAKANLLIRILPTRSPWLARFIAFTNGESIPSQSLPLDVGGTPFQQRTWQALGAIPRGETVSYTEVAQRLAQPRAVRAVANAIGANLIALAIPCHRVIHQDGSLGGFGWGVERKRAILQSEK